MDFSEIIVAIIIGLVILAINSLGAKKQQNTKNQPRRQPGRSLMSEESTPTENAEKEDEESWGIPRVVGNTSYTHAGRDFQGIAQGPRRGRTARTRRGGIHSPSPQAITPPRSQRSPTATAGTTATATRVETRYPVRNNTRSEITRYPGRPVKPRNRRELGLYRYTRFCCVTSRSNRQHNRCSGHQRG